MPAAGGGAHILSSRAHEEEGEGRTTGKTEGPGRTGWRMSLTPVVALNLHSPCSRQLKSLGAKDAER
eukprot:1498134-Pyramimonas_sp.AAC.1